MISKENNQVTERIIFQNMESSQLLLEFPSIDSITLDFDLL